MVGVGRYVAGFRQEHLLGIAFLSVLETNSVLTCVLRVVAVVEVVVAITVEAVVVLWVDACWVWVLLL